MCGDDGGGGDSLTTELLMDRMSVVPCGSSPLFIIVWCEMHVHRWWMVNAESRYDQRERPNLEASGRDPCRTVGRMDIKPLMLDSRF